MFRKSPIAFRAPIGVGRRVRAKALKKGRDHSSTTVLLPPWVACKELRVMMGVDYPTCFRDSGVEVYGRGQNRTYSWRDNQMRVFHASNKSQVVIPFEAAANVAYRHGLVPRMIDPAIHWDSSTFNTSAIGNKMVQPVVVVLGHINHGKTTLIDSLAGTSFCQVESGGITQMLRPVTVAFDVPEFLKGSLSPPLPSSSSSDHSRRITFIDTPGHEAFAKMRSQSSSVADLGLVLVSCEKGGDIQTAEVLMQADRLDLPLVFALTKADLPHTNVELVKAELKAECNELFEAGLLSRNFSEQAAAAIAIAAPLGFGLDALRDALLLATYDSKWDSPPFPRVPLQPVGITPDRGASFEGVVRRSDCLVGCAEKPSAAALVLEVEKEECGQKLTAIVRHGIVHSGHYFSAGSSWGMVTDLSTARAGFTELANSAYVGDAISVKGPYEGVVNAGDQMLFTSLERAFRISQYRIGVERLAHFQTRGIPLTTSWGFDSVQRTDTPTDIYTKTRPIGPKGERREIRDLNSGDEDEVLPTVGADWATSVGRLRRPRVRVRPDHEAQRDMPTPATSLDTRTIIVHYPTLEAPSTHIPTQATGGMSDVYKPGSHIDGEERDGRVDVMGGDVLRPTPSDDVQDKPPDQGMDDNDETDLSEAQQAYLAAMWQRRVLPQPHASSKPVLPIILKTTTVGLLDVLLDELKMLEGKLGVRLPLVHGGIGQVTKTDIDHAEVECRYSDCPVYAMQVAIHPEAVRLAVKDRIEIRRFDVFSDIIEDVEQRCNAALSLRDSRRSRQSL